MKRLVTALGAPLLLALGLGQSDARLPAASLGVLPGAPMQAITPPASVPKPRVMRRPSLIPPRVQAPRAPGDVMPHSYPGLWFAIRPARHGLYRPERGGPSHPVQSADHSGAKRGASRLSTGLPAHIYCPAPHSIARPEKVDQK